MQTIDYAIDLGTTNSCLAVWEEGKVMVIRNQAGEEYTPSAVYRRQLREGVLQRVGRPARNLLASQESQADEEGTTDEFFGPVALEFKRRMGESGWRHRFSSGGGEASAVELSAEVLKELLNGVQQWRGTTPLAAVITCPAYFEQPQWDATREAGLLAGLKHVELLEEPVAASYAYGLDAQVAGSARWLVFDLGGGTFDCALVGVADGMLRILDHAGDNRLGGKNIDEAIVDRHLLPRLPEAVKQRTRRNRGSNWWRLKFAAEEAKIRLATVTEMEYILIDRLSGDPDFALECSLSREQLHAIEEEIIARAVAICRELLARHQFESQHIDRLLLVGGPTLSPYLRERLAEELRIPLDTSLDPMTAVAQGAAAYARSRLWGGGGKPKSGAVSVTLEYDPLTRDKAPLVTGRLSVAPATGWQIEVERTDSNGQRLWSSDKQKVNDEGAFSLRLPLEPGENHLRLSVFNPQGQMVPVAGGEFVITVVDILHESPPLPRGIGVITNTGEVDWLFEVGEQVAGRITRTHKHVTTKPLSRGEGGEVLSIPLVEGKEREGYLNRHIGTLEIRAQDAPRDLPPGSRVDITIELQSASREYRAWGWVDAWEREIPAIVLTSTDVDLSALRDELEELREEAQRLAPVAEEDSTVRIAYTETTETLIPEAERLLAAAVDDPDSGQRAEEQVRKLRKVIYPTREYIDDRNLWFEVKVKKECKECEENVRRAKDILSRAEPEARKRVQEEFNRMLEDYEAALRAQDAEEAKRLAFGEIPDLLIRNGLAEGKDRGPSAQPGVPVLSTQRGDTRPM